MVGGEAGGDPRSQLDSTFECSRLFDNPPEADERDLRRKDHAEDALGSAVAKAGHGDGAVGELRAAQVAGARARDEVVELPHELVQIFAIDVVKRGSDQAALP